MKNVFIKHIAIITATSSLLLAAYACSHLPLEEFPATANSTEEIGKLEAKQSEAFSQQVNVLSPVAFQKASEALLEAKKSRSNGEDSKATLKYVAEGNAYLKRANEVSGISRATLGEVIERRADAIKAGAPRLAKVDFERLDGKLTKVSKDIEDKDLKAAEQAKAELSQGYSQVELQAIKKEKLGAPATLIEQAINEGAKENASRTLAAAKKAHQDAEAFITANRHNKAGIDHQAAEALASAKRLLNIARQVKVVEKKDSEALYLEAEAQQKLLSAEKAQVKSKQSQLNNANANAATLGAENDGLAAEKSFQERLDAAKALFSKREATVYRDSNKLVIRMNSLAFPTGQSTLATSNFAILAKVQKVIKDLGESHITIEGHTDSTGARALNKRLSSERAAAIQAYFVANGVGASNVSVVGYGDTKPITSNNTVAGRAQNRRVDVIIDPMAFRS